MIQRHRWNRLHRARKGCTAIAALAVSLIIGAPAGAAEIKFLTSNAINTVIDQLGPQFEQASGHKLMITYGIGSVLKQKIIAGETFDVAILVGAVDDLIEQGKMVAGSNVVLGHTGYGVAVRKGAPKPDVSTSEALKRALLAAKAVAYTEGGGSGAYFLRVLDRLGIAEQMKPKLIAASESAEVVANGQADLTVNGLAPIMRAAGVELAGPLPPDLQSYSSFVGGVSPGAKEPDAGRALLTFLSSTAAGAVWKSRGVEPGPPKP